MLFRPALLAIIALVPLALGQTDSSDSDLTDGFFADFPAQCKDTCSRMEGTISQCSTIGDSASEAESFACVCNDSFVRALEDCGSCIVPAAGLSSESGNVIAQLAISVGRGCGLPVQIDGITNPEISSTNRQPIPNTGSLKDRIAKLNLDPTSSSPSSASSPRQPGAGSGPPSPTAQRKTGATTKISDKISRFQANAEETPLLPSGGSFGLAPARPSAFRDGSKGSERGRVASLGAGRAPVPLNVVTPTRSVSTGNIGATPRTASENGSVGSGTRGSVGSGGGEDSRPGTPSASRRGSTQGSSATPSQNDVAIASDSPSSHLDNHLANLLTPGPRTPGAMSVSSMNVETGSIASEGDRNASEADLTPSLGPTDVREPSDIPGVDQQGRDKSLDLPASNSSVASSDDFPPTPPALPVKGPLDHLRQPSRSASIASLSSLVVEAPPDDVADLSAISNSGRPSTISEVASEPRTIVTPTPTDDGNEEDEADEKRLERTNEELTRYERDEEDPTAHGPGPENNGDRGLPVRPTWEAEDDAAGMPKAKCSDCDADVDLVELADHSCAPSREPPSLTSPPASPANRHTELAEPESSPSRAGHDDTPERADTVPSAPTPRLDDYVPQTTSVVPEDIAPEEEEDVLDFYGDGPVSPASASYPFHAHAHDADVPLDPEEGTNHEGQSSSLSMSRSLSQPTARAPKEPAGPRSHSVYLPGHYDDEEESYEGGTVTIVRSSR
ncbi:hypothetical protein JCM11491_004957 [Sporobolomyces phaffii]